MESRTEGRTDGGSDLAGDLKRSSLPHGRCSWTVLEIIACSLLASWFLPPPSSPLLPPMCEESRTLPPTHLPPLPRCASSPDTSQENSVTWRRSSPAPPPRRDIALLLPLSSWQRAGKNKGGGRWGGGRGQEAPGAALPALSSVIKN